MAKGKDGKGKNGNARTNLAKALNAIGIKNVTPDIIRAASDFTGAQPTIDFLRKPSEEEIYYGNAVGRLKSDEQIMAEQTGAFDRTAKIAQDLAISVPGVVSGFTGALGGLAGDLAAFGGGDARALVGMEGAGASAANQITAAGKGIQGVSASVADLIAANADLYAAQSRAARDTRREELLKEKRMATSERKKALAAAQAAAQSGILSNIVTLLGLKESSGGGYGGGGSGRRGSGGDGRIKFDATKANQFILESGRNMEGLISTTTPTTTSSDEEEPTSVYSTSQRNVGAPVYGGTTYTGNSWQGYDESGMSLADWNERKKQAANLSNFPGIRGVPRGGR